MQIPQRGAQDGREPAGSGGMAKAPRRLQEHPTSVKIRQTHRQAGQKRVGRNLLVAMSSDASKFADEAAVSQRIQLRRRSEEHTSELQSLMRISYAVFCLKKKNIKNNTPPYQRHSKVKSR